MPVDDFSHDRSLSKLVSLTKLQFKGKTSILFYQTIFEALTNAFKICLGTSYDQDTNTAWIRISSYLLFKTTSEVQNQYNWKSLCHSLLNYLKLSSIKTSVVSTSSTTLDSNLAASNICLSKQIPPYNSSTHENIPRSKSMKTFTTSNLFISSSKNTSKNNSRLSMTLRQSSKRCFVTPFFRRKGNNYQQVCIVPISSASSIYNNRKVNDTMSSAAECILYESYRHYTDELDEKHHGNYTSNTVNMPTNAFYIDAIARSDGRGTHRLRKVASYSHDNNNNNSINYQLQSSLRSPYSKSCDDISKLPLEYSSTIQSDCHVLPVENSTVRKHIGSKSYEESLYPDAMDVYDQDTITKTTFAATATAALTVNYSKAWKSILYANSSTVQMKNLSHIVPIVSSIEYVHPSNIHHADGSMNGEDYDEDTDDDDIFI